MILLRPRHRGARSTSHIVFWPTRYSKLPNVWPNKAILHNNQPIHNILVLQSNGKLCIILLGRLLCIIVRHINRPKQHSVGPYRHDRNEDLAFAKTPVCSWLRKEHIFPAHPQSPNKTTKSKQSKEYYKKTQ